MPNISAAALQKLKDQAQDVADLVEALRRQVAALRAERDDLNGRVNRFDATLDQIVRAAQGQSLRLTGGYADTMVSVGQIQPRELTADERRERQLDDLHERVVTLEARLAAATAIASYAKGRP